ncbi:MAG: PAS domain S-box protein [Candidatus Margulisiibacteriota bacterium]
MTNEKLHHLLKRQLNKYFGTSENLPENLLPLINSVNDAYFQADSDRKLLEHSFDLSSEEMREANRVVQESEARYRGIFNAVTDGLLIFDLNGTIVSANARASEMYGYPQEKMIGLTGKEIVTPEYHPLFQNFLAVVGAGGVFTGESIDRQKNGTPFNVEIKGSAFSFQGKPHLLAVVTDTTERKKSEQTITRKIAELEAIVEAATGRELKMIGLEKEVNALLVELGRQPKYK